MDITKKITTFEDACKVLGLEPENLPIVEHLPEKDRQSIIAYYKLTIIARALNEGWEPDFSDCNQWKYWNWFYVETSGATAGFACALTDYAASNTHAGVGSRLCFKTRELATYARENFRDLYFEYLFIDMPKNYRK
ncbi:MAG: hypothetical protein EZS26_000776 [Candidatus Ordinivivax streblomastigis]|uniref:Uncharacterized protein n=1 Tax=Candidatus Ordinivivax streblomastigis TaxID=2540710 RepID=A0A5M8P3Z0_9BACT|nr:MAG: hypothetical protein EZS26_000776 [Candidatus Ordinivivax streblomastigis]